MGEQEAALACLQAEAQEAKRVAVEEQHRAAEARRAVLEEQRCATEAANRLAERDREWLCIAKEAEVLRRTLQVREQEVRELQLVGKYFAGHEQRPSVVEFGLAELTEGLRARCAKLSAEAAQLRVERDVLRAEQHVARC